MRFKEVIGQQKLKSDLIRAVLADKISHAQLFSGQAGFGTLPLALAYIQFLFCEQKQKDDIVELIKEFALNHSDDEKKKIEINDTLKKFIYE